MKIIAINGSPRKEGNTARMCQEFLRGAEAAGADTEIVHLYDLCYTGCKSCFACKRAGSSTYGHCVVKDDIEAVLNKTVQADGVVFASPVYCGEITAQLKGFLERLLFPFVTYEEGYRTIAPRKMPTAMIYTMNLRKEGMEERGYTRQFLNMENYISRVFSAPELFYAWNTYQFKNYAAYKVEVFSEKDKAAYRQEQFPLECQKAFFGGKAMAEKAAQA